MAVRSEQIEMPLDEFERLPWRWGWKYEYMDGCAIVSPRDHYVFVRAPVTPHLASLPCDDHDLHIQSVAAHDDPVDIKRLVSAFIDAFVETAEFCDYEYAQIEAAAWKRINGFFASKHGRPHPASRIAIVPDEHHPVVGAALIARREDGPVLDLLFVRRAWQRTGLATRLVARVMNELYVAGATSLRSAYHVANEQSAAWHRRFGFEEEPDLFLTKLRLGWTRHEIHRRKSAADSGEVAERERLEDEANRLREQIVVLERAAEQDGYESVVPILRYS